MASPFSRAQQKAFGGAFLFRRRTRNPSPQHGAACGVEGSRGGVPVSRRLWLLGSASCL